MVRRFDESVSRSSGEIGRHRFGIEDKAFEALAVSIACDLVP